MEPPTEQRDPRMDFLSNYTCKALRLKEDKWSRMMVSDEQRSYLSNFMENSWPQARFFFLSRKFYRNLINWKKSIKKFNQLTIVLYVGLTETKYIKLKTKPQNNIVIFGNFP